MGSGLEGFDFSHEGVKRVVGLLIGFVSVIASAPYRFLYLNQRIQDLKKKKKKRKKSPLLPSFFTLPGISFMIPVLQNISYSILRTKTHAKDPQTLTLVCDYAISLDA